MKLLKIVFSFLCAVPFVCLSCTCTKSGYDAFTMFFYDEEDNVLLVMNGLESSRYIHKIEMDLLQDTLSIRVHKRLVFRGGRTINAARTNWKIKLQPNVQCVKFGNVLMNLSELDSYPGKDGPYPTIQIFPEKFPCVAE